MFLSGIAVVCRIVTCLVYVGTWVMSCIALVSRYRQVMPIYLESHIATPHPVMMLPLILCVAVREPPVMYAGRDAIS